MFESDQLIRILEFNIRRNLIGSSRHGSSVSMDKIGKILAIGDPADNGDRGAVWMFQRINNKWVFKTKIVYPDSVGNYTDSIGKSLIGSSVSLSNSGSCLIIGGPGDDNGM